MTQTTTEAEPSALAPLLVRVEGADGPTVELFYKVARALLPDHFPSTIDHDQERVEWVVLRFGKFVGVGAWTDASLALCERVLPGCLWTVKHLGEGDFAADVGSPDFQAVMYGSEVMRSRALALLAALLKAKIAEDASPEGAALGLKRTP